MTTAQPLLEAIELTKRFPLGGGGLLARRRRTVQAVDGVSLAVMPGETLGLVGESGCGKSTLGRCMVRLYEISSGRLRFEGREIGDLGLRQLRPIRRRLQMIFQDSSSLNPRRRVGDLIAEPLRVHGHASAAEIRARERQLMELVGLSPNQLDRFPHEFSGGQRQRVGIARALALEPALIVADEPVSALDVSVRAQIVNLFVDLQQRLGLTYVFIAHDLSVVRQVSTKVAVMYLGSIVELADGEELFRAPAHPYTEALISAVPLPRRGGAARHQQIVLQGEVPSPAEPPTGCRFHPRCRYAQAPCRGERPPLHVVGPGRQVACHFPLDG